MKKSNLGPAKKALDKTDWKKVINEPEAQTDIKSLSDKENPILINRKFRKSKK